MRISTRGDLEQHFAAKVEIQESFGGGNSFIHKIKLGNSLLAVKEYIGNAERITSSFQRETSALRFLNDFKVITVPNILYSQENLGFIVMEYINGKKPKANRQSIDAILNFIESLRDLFLKDPSFAFAVDAGTSLLELQNQIEVRLAQGKYKSREFVPKVERILDRLRKSSDDKNIGNNLTYSVSDLGLHNSLVSEKGYFFFDLEFFGKDSPYKMIGDFLLHPQNHFSKVDNEYFLERSFSLFNLNREYLAKIFVYLATKWSLICIKRLENLIDSTGTSEAIQSQITLVRYYLDMATSLSLKSDLDSILSSYDLFS